jgi:hypothetical protein
MSPATSSTGAHSSVGRFDTVRRSRYSLGDVVKKENSSACIASFHARSRSRRSLRRERLVVAGGWSRPAAVLRRPRSLRGRPAPRNRRRRNDSRGDPRTGWGHGDLRRHRAEPRVDDHDCDCRWLCRDADARRRRARSEVRRRRRGRNRRHGRAQRRRGACTPVRASRHPRRARRAWLRRSAFAPARARGSRIGARAGGACSCACAGVSSGARCRRRVGWGGGSTRAGADACLGAVDVHGVWTRGGSRCARRRLDRTAGAQTGDPCFVDDDRPSRRHVASPHARSSGCEAGLLSPAGGGCANDSDAVRRHVLADSSSRRGNTAGDGATRASLAAEGCLEQPGRRGSAFDERACTRALTRLARRACSGGSRAGATRSAATRGAAAAPPRSGCRRCLHGSRGSRSSGGPP